MSENTQTMPQPNELMQNGSKSGSVGPGPISQGLDQSGGQQGTNSNQGGK